MCRDRQNKDSDLRIAGIQRGKKIGLKVDANPVTAYEGETVHAALTAADIRCLKHSKSNQARGVFCGMGICYECLVTIDQIPDQRACMTLVQDQMEIRTHEG
jgi:sarcosine oxidase subunit alpha